MRHILVFAPLHHVIGPAGAACPPAGPHPSRLSGRQRQRVAIARALALRRRMLVLDEVTSALDPEVIGEVILVIRRLSSEHDPTMLMVMYRMSLAREIPDRIYGGRIAEQGSPGQLFGEPRNERAREFPRAVLEAD